MSEDISNLLKEKFASDILAVDDLFQQTTVVLRKDNIHEILEFLKNDPRTSFEMLLDVCGVDYLKMKEAPHSERYEVIYHLYSLTLNHRVRLRVKVPEEDMSLKTATDLWPSANWAERETAEMFGIVFTGHPNPKNLLLYQGFPGHPLRKDYPVDKRHEIPIPLEKV